MMPSRRLLLGAAVLAVVALLSAALGGCAPPKERGRDRTSTTAAAAQKTTGGEQPADVVADGASDAATNAGSTHVASMGDAHVAKGTDAPRNVVFEELRTGAFVPRCPECGETQPDGATRCAGCGQELAPWRRDTLCPQCAGSGSCLYCGDDRPCLTCGTDGRCANCDGTGEVGGQRCAECSGSGGCPDCRGDGVRSSVAGDFAPGESHLPGICTTCLYGSGLCPTCGDGQAGCPTCGGDGLCPDCRGSGVCPYDRGDGLCATCDGAGHEVVNGPRGTPADRIWSVRRADGSVLDGDVPHAPGPDLTVMVTKGRKVTALTLIPGNVDPISYYIAARDFTALDDADGRVALARVALASGLLPLARREMERATTLDASRARRLASKLREIDALRAHLWIERARETAALGNRERATLLYRMVIARSPSEADAARVALGDMQSASDTEVAGLDEATRARRREARVARVRRTVTRASRRLEVARRRLSAARDTTRGAHNVRLSFAGADRSALRAEELIRSDAFRAPPTQTDWPQPPSVLLAEARSLRAAIALAQAVEEVAGGRFALGRRLAWQARDIDPETASVDAVVDEAERGMMRRGVRTATVPPQTKQQKRK